MLSLQAEQARVAKHIHQAELLAARRDTSSLDEVQLLVRKLLLQELSHYRAEGRFPKNHTFSEPTPTFIDAEGTRCAVGHLLEVGGQGELALRIARERNHARVKELADEPLLLAWLEAAGLTVEEAAAIQPSYGCTTPAQCVCGEGWSRNGEAVPATAVLQAIVETEQTARIEKVYGETTWRVGDVVNIGYGTPNTQLLIGLDSRAGNRGADGGQPLDTRVALTAGKFQCRDQGSPGDSPPLSVEHYAEAVMAKDCKATLIRLDPAYSANPCGPGGCSSAAGSQSPSLAILFAVVGVLMARRLRTARGSTAR